MEKPTRVLSHWGLFTLRGEGPFLTGYENYRTPWISTALIEFDPVVGTARTASGRPYRLVGQLSKRQAKAAVQEIWGNTEGAVFLDSEEGVRLVDAVWNTPITDSEQLRRRGEVDEVSDLRLRYRSAIRILKLSEETAAATAMLPVEALRQLFNAEPVTAATLADLHRGEILLRAQMAEAGYGTQVAMEGDNLVIREYPLPGPDVSKPAYDGTPASLKAGLAWEIVDFLREHGWKDEKAAEVTDEKVGVFRHLREDPNLRGFSVHRLNGIHDMLEGHIYNLAWRGPH